MRDVIGRAASWLDRCFVGPGTGRALAAARIGVLGALAVRLATRDWTDLVGRDLYVPLGLLEWYPGRPSVAVVLAVQIVGVAAAVAALLARRARPMAAVAWSALLFLAALRTAGGKILHNDVLLLVGALPVVLAPTDAELADREPSARFGWPVRASVAAITTVYLLTGVQKLRYSGLEWAFSDNLRWVLYGAAAAGRAPTTAAARAVADHPWAYQSFAAGALGLELVAPLALFWTRSRVAIGLALVAMHAGIYLTMGLDYWAWMLIDLVVLVAVPLVDGLRAPGSSATARSSTGTGGTAG